MSGFPGPRSYAETLAEQLRAEQEQKRSDAHYTPPERTPDADDFCDALFLRAVLTRAGDRKTADMLEAAAWRIRELERKEGKKNAES